MAISDRQAQILKRVRATGFVSVDDLVDEFQVTPQTVRRDINRLCDEGLLRRFHGGAGLPSGAENLEYDARKVLHHEAKRRIAERVGRHIPNDASLFVNLGTTTEAVARRLRGHEGLRVITNNLNVAAVLGRSEQTEVIIAGGVIRPRDLGITGEATIDFIRQFRVDFGVIGISGIEEDGTLRDFDYHEVRVSEAIIQQSRQVLLVADCSKFGRNALVRLGHLRDVDILFTDEPPPESMSAVIGEAGLRVCVASDGPAAAV